MTKSYEFSNNSLYFYTTIPIIFWWEQASISSLEFQWIHPASPLACFPLNSCHLPSLKTTSPLRNQVVVIHRSSPHVPPILQRLLKHPTRLLLHRTPCIIHWHWLPCEDTGIHLFTARKTSDLPARLWGSGEKRPASSLCTLAPNSPFSHMYLVIHLKLW